jgi:heat shock protein HspQ
MCPSTKLAKSVTYRLFAYRQLPIAIDKEYCLTPKNFYGTTFETTKRSTDPLKCVGFDDTTTYLLSAINQVTTCSSINKSHICVKQPATADLFG